MFSNKTVFNPYRKMAKHYETKTNKKRNKNNKDE